MTEIEWLQGKDTGISSKTIFAVMTGTVDMGPFSGGIPYDPSDFGRCYRLLQHFPQWRARLPEVARRHPEWGPMVEAWDELTALYEQEAPNHRGTAPKLYERMQELVAAGREASGWTRTGPHGWIRTR